MSDRASTIGNQAFDRTGESHYYCCMAPAAPGVCGTVIPLFADEQEVIALDLPGHRASCWWPELTAPPIGYAPMVGPILDRLGLESVDVAGNSMPDLREAAAGPVGGIL